MLIRSAALLFFNSGALLLFDRVANLLFDGFVDRVALLLGHLVAHLVGRVAVRNLLQIFKSVRKSVISPVR